MSYCVNCGVELDKTAKACALCNTPVLNPNQPIDSHARMPFPKEKGQVEDVKRKDMGILLTTVVLATAVTCGLLNAFVFTGPLWSLAVIGVCVLLWVILLPVVFIPKQHIYISILFDGMAVALYLYMLSFLSGSEAWLWGLGIPVVIFVTVIVEVFTFAVRRLPRSFLTVGLYAFTAIGILCTGLEILIDRYLGESIALKWSAIVMTVCVIIDIALITMLSLRRLRNAVRRRLHF